jgi:hypothetical protein
MHRLTNRGYRQCRWTGAVIGAIIGIAALARSIVVAHRLQMSGANRIVDVSPLEVPAFLVLGALLGWTAVSLWMHFADATPDDMESAEDA